MTTLASKAYLNSNSSLFHVFVWVPQHCVLFRYSSATVHCFCILQPPFFSLWLHCFITIVLLPFVCFNAFTLVSEPNSDDNLQNLRRVSFEYSCFKYLRDSTTQSLHRNFPVWRALQGRKQKSLVVWSAFGIVVFLKSLDQF